MFLAQRMVLTVAVLTLPVRPVVSNDLGEGDAEGLGHAFYTREGRYGGNKKGIKGEREEANDKEDKVCATKVKC